MKLTLTVLKVELFSLNLDPEPVQETCTCAEPEFEPYQDAGSTGCTFIGFAPSAQPEWERPLNRYDEPAEGDEDV